MAARRTFKLLEGNRIAITYRGETSIVSVDCSSRPVFKGEEANRFDALGCEALIDGRWVIAYSVFYRGKSSRCGHRIGFTVNTETQKLIAR